jgi:hypothetical protein
MRSLVLSRRDSTLAFGWVCRREERKECEESVFVGVWWDIGCIACDLFGVCGVFVWRQAGGSRCKEYTAFDTGEGAPLFDGVSFEDDG